MDTTFSGTVSRGQIMTKFNSGRSSGRVSKMLILVLFVSTFLVIIISLHYFTGSNEQKFHVEIRQSEMYSKRSARVEDFCWRKPRTGMKGVFYSETYNLCYCDVPKVGSTFWKQIIRFLNKDTDGKEYDHPLDIPRSLVHGKPKETTLTFFKGKEKYFSNYDRFMFVRDPYSRLWSAYIDKVYLPDLWFHQMEHSARFSPNVNCPLNTTFEESLQWAVDAPLEKMDPHWTPMYFSCDPCEFKPQFIGKQETFVEDARYVLSRHNLSWILDECPADHSKAEVEMLVEHDFNLLQDTLTAQCIDGKETAVRLWRAFQINGHLSSEEQFPLSHVKTVTEEEFKSVVFEALNRQTKSSSELKQQKFLYMVQAYQGLSYDTLEAIRKKYAFDFEMFGYDPFNPDIFSTQ